MGTHNKLTRQQNKNTEHRVSVNGYTMLAALNKR